MNAESKTPALLAQGGKALAIIPQSIEETWRIATMVVRGGLAPQSLIGRTDISTPEGREAAASAVAICIMSGAELGMPPMAALRSIAVINGRPALYGDGLIGVVRSRDVCESVRTGYAEEDFALMDKAGALGDGKDADKRKRFDAMDPDERKFGWCTAKRRDTGEERTVIFSIADAKQARLWDEREKVTRYKKGGGGTYEVPNDAPWFRFWKRMLAWRAAGYCLRELFAEIIGGFLTEDEAKTIEAEYTVEEKTPPPPAPSLAELIDDEIPQEAVQESDEREAEPDGPQEPETPASDEQEPEQAEKSSGPPPSAPRESLFDEDPEEPVDEFIVNFMEQLDSAMEQAMTVEDIDQVWADLDAEAILADAKDEFKLMDDARKRHYARVSPLNGG